MQRCNIKEEDKWDLTKYYKNETEYENAYQETLNILEKIKKMQGTITQDADTLYTFLELEDKLSLNIEQIYVYSYLLHYSDQTAELGKKYKEKADKLDEKIVCETAFVNSELLSVSYDYIKMLIAQNKNLEKYRFNLEKIFRYKKHTLSKEEEQIISLASSAFGTPDNAFSALDNADAKFGSIVIDGKKIQITHSNFVKLMTSKNRDLRRKVFNKYYNFFVTHNETISQLYKGQVKEDTFASKVRKFNSPLEQSMFNDNISPEVYTNLINTIHSNLKPMYEYLDFRKKYLKLDSIHMYDLYTDLVEGTPREFTFAEAKQTILEALKPLGSKYINDLSKAFTERWIDKYPNDGKRSGAYQWGSYGVDPYVSVNFEGTEDSVSTLAHELGHAMHSYYSDTTQPHIYAQYPIFLAEIASTVNEVLLNEYLINHAKDDNEKLLYITSFLDKFRTTVYRQTMFAEFEMIIHNKELNGEPITNKILNETYYKLNKLYYGKDVKSDKLIQYEWSRIPHFYTSFYVYKYATGFCAALSIASDILSGKEGACAKYLEFLKSGSSKYPLDILKSCNVDMTTSEPIIKGIKMFEEKLKQAIDLVKR